MRLPNRALVASVLLSLACLPGLAGCTSTSGVDVLRIGPSNETTSSIVRPRVPVEDVAADLSGSADAAGVEEDGEPVIEPIALAEVPNPAKPPPTVKGGTIYDYDFKDAEPINFGKRSPRKLDVHGVDVSRWQGDIDWRMLRRHGANFVYIKATDGGDHLDPMFMRNWRDADKAGLRRGAYHFFYWCRTASSQADWFIRNVPRTEGALPPVLDVEWNHESSCRKRPSRAVVLEKMKVFLERLERHYGQRPVIYTSPDFYADNLKGAFLDYPFWLRSVAVHPSKVYPGREWLFWQYSGSGLSGAVEGRIDLNVFNGDERDWWRWVARAEG